MNIKRIVRMLAACSLLLPFLLLNGTAEAQTRPALQPAYGNLPLTFEPNRGQTDATVQWVSRGNAATVFLTGADAVIEMSKLPLRGKRGEPLKPVENSSLRMNLLGARTPREASGEEAAGGTANYFTGNDPKQWRSAIPLFTRVHLEQVYPGIDIAYYGTQGRLEYDFVVAPGADASQIRLGFDGTTARLDRDGNLLLPLGSQTIRFGKPIVFQTLGGHRQPVNAGFAIAANHEVTFALDAYDHTRALTIDPVLVYAGVLGTANQQTIPTSIAVDTAGELLITGYTNDLTFPTTTGAYQTTCGTALTPSTRCGGSSLSSAFVTKISADGTQLIYSSYLHGGSGQEQGLGITADAAGVAYLVGNTLSDDFPVTSDAYSKLCSPGQSYNLQTSTYNPPSASCSYNFGGNYYFNAPSMYLTKLNAAGTALLYSTFFGGTGNDEADAVALDGSGNIYIAGSSSSSVSPTFSGALAYPTTTSAYESNGISDGFSAVLSKFSNDGHTLLYSTFLGSPQYAGTNTFNGALAVSAGGIAYLGGYTFAADFPLSATAVKKTCGLQSGSTTSCKQAYGFAAAIDTTRSGAASLVYSTFVSGDQNALSNSVQTQISGLAVDSTNNLYLAGHTYNSDFPTTAGSFEPACPILGNSAHCDTAFLSKLNPSGSAYVWSTFFSAPNGTGSTSSGNSVAVDAKGRVYLYGESNGADIPTLNPVQVPQQGGDKLFVAALSTDASTLLFGTRFGSANTIANEDPVGDGGLALDAAGNIYFAGTTNNGAFQGTTGTYATAQNGGFLHGIFGKISPVLATSVTTLSIAPATTITGQSVTFTATVKGTTPNPTGTVTLVNTKVTPNVTLGTIQLGAGGIGTFSTSSLAAGTYTVVARYNADTVYDYSASAAQTLTINTPTGDTVTLSLANASVKVGSQATFNVTVAGPNGSATPTGTVYFLDGTTTLGSAVLASGTASYSTAALGVGTHSITASYAGDTVYGATTSAAQTESVTAYSSTLTLAATPTLAIPGAAISLTATIVPASGTVAPTGKISFLDGTTVIGSGTIANGTVGFSTTALAAGTHVLSATYAGDTNFGTSASATVTVVLRVPAATTTTLSSSSASVNKGGSVTLTATISSTATTGSPTGSVSFFDGTTSIGTGTVANNIATLTTSTLAAGMHSLSAVYAGDTLFLTSQSTAVTETVVAPGFSVTASPNPLVIQRGQTGSTTITVTPSGGYTGTISFGCGNLPTYVSCSFAPPTLVFTAASGPMTDVLTVGTTSASHAALVAPVKPGISFATLLGLPALLLGLGLTRRKLRRRVSGLLLLILVGVGLGAVSGCASNNNFNTAAPGTYAVSLSLTGSDGSAQNLNLSVTVQ